MQGPSAGRKHAADQNTERDVIEDMTENVHGVVPAMRKIAVHQDANVTQRRDRTPLPRGGRPAQCQRFRRRAARPV
jgi:hypothetical protein